MKQNSSDIKYNPQIQKGKEYAITWAYYFMIKNISV